MRRSLIFSAIFGLAGAATGVAVAAGRRDRSTAARLEGSLERPAASRTGRFDPSMLAGLPEPVRSYLEHAIAPGTALARAVRLEMEGRIRLGSGLPWLPFNAHQVLAPPAGFIWQAHVGTFPLRFDGADSYANGRGRVTFRLWDLLPIVRGDGPDVSRSARGRLAIESIWLPTALLPGTGVSWEGLSARSARATIILHDEAIPVTFAFGPDGSLRSVSMPRWGNLTPDGRHEYLPFGADVDEERTFGGYTVPSRVRVAWRFGTAQRFDFFEGRLTSAVFLSEVSR